jgi:hypothetical protein
MSLVQFTLNTQEDIKYKSMYLDIKKNTTLNDVFNLLSDLTNNKIELNKNKIVINQNLYMLDDLTSNFINFLTDQQIEYNELDDLEIICFANLVTPPLVFNQYLTDIYKNHINTN